MKNFLRRVFVPIFMTAALLSVSGCSLGSFIESRLVYSSDKVGTETAKTIYEYLTEGDVEGLTGLFCEEEFELHDIEAELEELLGMIDGNITSYEKVNVWNSGESKRDGEVVKAGGCFSIDNIKTDTDKTYKVSFYQVTAYQENEKLVGVHYIRLKSVSDESDDEKELTRAGEYLVPNQWEKNS